MELKTIIIIGLVLYMAFWYFNPDKGKDIIDDGIDKAQNLWDGLLINISSCPDTYDPVCVHNQTEYENPCWAVKAGYDNYTIGVC